MVRFCSWTYLAVICIALKSPLPSMITFPVPSPFIVTCLFISRFSIYIPGRTRIVSPGLAAFMADCIVLYSEGTMMSVAALTGVIVLIAMDTISIRDMYR